MKKNDPDPLQPLASLLVKIGSIAVHAQELFGPLGHHFDRIAMKSLLNDPEVNAWIESMTEMAMLPKKRS